MKKRGKKKKPGKQLAGLDMADKTGLEPFKFA